MDDQKFSAFWARLCSKNPSLRVESSKMTLTVSVFKSQMRKAFREGGDAKPALDFDFLETLKSFRG